MPVVYNAALQAGLANFVMTELDGGPANAVIEFLTSGGTVLIQESLDSPVGTVATGEISFSGFPKTVTPIATGQAAEVRVRSSDSLKSYDGITLGLPGDTPTPNFILDDINLVSGVDILINTVPKHKVA